MYRSVTLRSEPTSGAHSQRIGLIAAALFVVLVVVVLRLAVVGGYPSTDEGIYGYYALIIHDRLSQDLRLPNDGMLMLYPLMTSFVYSLNVNPIFAFRLIDIVPDALAAVLMLRISARLSGSLTASALITALFFALLNHPAFIQYGFKNSFFIALCPLLYAVILFLSEQQASSSRYLAMGVLVALGVLLRETLLLFAVLGAVTIFVERGTRGLKHYVAGGLAAGSLILILAIALRGSGGVSSLIAGYVDTGAGYGAFGDLRLKLFKSSGQLAAQAAAAGLVMSLVATACIVIASIRGRTTEYLKPFAFWAAVTLIPFVEPLAKLGFPYHFSWSLIGLCGITSLGWSTCQFAGRAQKLICSCLCIGVSLLLVWPQLNFQRSIFWGLTYPALKETHGKYWADESIPNSNYLLLADEIKRVAPANATLSSSAAMLILYPLTGLRPPCYGVSNLTVTAVTLHFDEKAVKRAIESCPADVVVATERDLPGSSAVTQAIRELPQYRPAGRVDASTARDYGNSSAELFLRQR
ncbi:glycosyltransferase family protein [Paraburkholderia sp. RL17-373-BIF-A]|uniref:hypothetical protein n=1 Tax=Paraburkholderia sp. RL17-373-BIF-A TaxID=3031629 RepID=UPI0038BD578D